MGIVEHTKQGLGLAEIIKNAPMKIDRNMNMIGRIGETITVPDPSLNNGRGGVREGQFFVQLPTELAEALPGSELLAVDFLQSLGWSKEGAAFTAKALEGTAIALSADDPLLAHREELFSLNVYHGSLNNEAQELSELAESLNSPDNTDKLATRARYQEVVHDIFKPVATYASEYDHRIVEDCIASADTILGSLVMLDAVSKLGIRGSRVRVDVVTATTQGILVLRQFALENGIHLEINVGHLAYGLTAGVPIEGSNAREHANYLVYPKHLREQLDDDSLAEVDEETLIQVVGDMGDAFNSLPEEYDNDYQWNTQRLDDSHGDRGGAEQARPKDYVKGMPVHLYFANGGYFMRSLMRHWGLETQSHNEVMFSAKRVWSSEARFGYGVVVNNLPQTILN